MSTNSNAAAATTQQSNNTKPEAAAVADSTSNDRFLQAKRAREAALAARAGQREEMPRERVPDLGGQRLKLSVQGEIPGHHLYWENDEDGRIEQLLFDGFDFVQPGEVNRASDLVADMDLANRISRYVGRREDGSPLRAYLMKCPQDIWDARQANGLDLANERDRHIRNERMKPQEHQYVPKGYESSLKTNSKF